MSRNDLVNPDAGQLIRRRHSRASLALATPSQDELLPLLVNRLDSTESILPYDYYQ